jgi:hypothetical protein
MDRTSTSFTEDLRAVPEDVRQSAREADQKLQEMAAERPAFAKALDLRLLAAAAVAALVVAFLARLAGVGFVLSLVLFLVLFLGGWLGLASAAAPRRANR